VVIDNVLSDGKGHFPVDYDQGKVDVRVDSDINLGSVLVTSFEVGNQVCFSQDITNNASSRFGLG
jgi:hypothetical protein